MIDLITEHLDIWTSAQEQKKTSGKGRGKKTDGKSSIYGIKKLRELILELAVRGKLVPQDPNYEPADVLLEKISEEKKRLIKEGEIKEQKKLPEIKENEKSFDLPPGWAWVKLGNLMNMYNGRAFKSSEWSEDGLPIVRIQNLNNSNAPFNHYNGDVQEQHIIDNDTFLISWSGTPGTSFGAFIWNRGRAALNQHINKCLIFSNDINQDYLKLAVNSCMKHLIAQAQGGVGLKHVTKGTLNNTVFAYPPHLEQERIVTKVNELMSLCDKLEQEQTEQNAIHHKLVENLLTNLVRSTDQEEFSRTWQYIVNNFNTLFISEETLKFFEEIILELAVNGNLINFNKSGTEYLVKDLLHFGPRNGFSPKESPYETDTKVFKLGATTKGYLDTRESKYVDIDVTEDSHLWVREGDILIQRGNAATYVGSNVLVEKNEPGFIYPDLMMKIRVNEIIHSEYLSLVLSAPSSRKYMWDRMTGTSGTMPKISKKTVENIPVIIPNLKIQEKIILFVDHILQLTITLRKKIVEKESTKFNLTNSLFKT